MYKYLYNKEYIYKQNVENFIRNYIKTRELEKWKNKKEKTANLNTQHSTWIFWTITYFIFS
jgi:hypothetical protein